MISPVRLPVALMLLTLSPPRVTHDNKNSRFWTYFHSEMSDWIFSLV